MDIAAGDRRVKLSVREFSEFHLGPHGETKGPSGEWRARLGQKWHQVLRMKNAERFPNASFEKVVGGFLEHGGWSFEVEGRLDQMVEEDEQIRVTEVKTITNPLPADEQELRDRYPHYFIQLATYLVLLQASSPKKQNLFHGEILFVDVVGGIPQTIPLEQNPNNLFQEQANNLICFLEERRKGSERLRSLSHRPPFETLRPGQKETVMELESQVKHCSTLLLEAPTGFGKTGILLEFVLRRLKEGLFDRVLYLTGKATSQGEIVRQIKAMVPNGKLRFLQIRNKREHALDRSGKDARMPSDEMRRRWEAADISPQKLFHKGSFTLENARELGSRTGVPPYEFMRACLPFADLWIGDYNYVFQPNSAQLIDDLQGYLPERTILIVDEAHNLPDRVTGGLSPRFEDGATARLRIELQGLGKYKILDDLLGELGRYLSTRREGEVLDPDAAYEATDLLERFCEILAVYPVPYSDLSPDNLSLLWDYARAAKLLEDGCPRQMWSPEDGVLEIACLDAAPHIADRLSRFGLIVLASATLKPIEEFACECGLPSKSYVKIRGETPWRKGACRVAIDIRADTRYAHRAQHYNLTTETIRSASNYAVGPIAAFFPSYRYAEEIHDRIRAEAVQPVVALQPKLTNLGERIAFLENALETVDVLLLILGSSFSEGIDLLGGKIETAVVVGPALPQMNQLREARLETLLEGGRSFAFRRIYQIPGMRKVNQAIGRLIRQPGHRANLLLHGYRFSLPEYQELLEDEYRHGTVLRDDQDLAAWFGENSTNSS